MRLRHALVWSVPGVLVCLQPALAQEPEDRRFKVEGQLHADYDTNVARINKSLAQASGVDPSDAILSAVLRADVLAPVSRQTLFLTGYVARDFYANNKNLETTRADLSGGANLHFGVCDGPVSQTYQRSRGASQLVGIEAIRNVQTLSSTSVSATCGRILAPTAALSWSQGENSTPLLSTTDFRSHSALLGLAYRRRGLGRIDVYGRREESRLPHQLVLRGGGLAQDGFDLNAVGVRLERHIGARIGGQADLSFSKVEPRASGVPAFSGLTYAVQTDYAVNPRLALTGGFERSAIPTTQIGATYTVAKTVRADATYTVGPRLKLQAGVLRTANSYRGTGVVAVGPFLSRETLSSLTGGARFEVNRRIAVLVDTRWEKRSSNVRALDYSSVRVGAGLVAKF